MFIHNFKTILSTETIIDAYFLRSVKFSSIMIEINKDENDFNLLDLQILLCNVKIFHLPYRPKPSGAHLIFNLILKI